MCYNQYTIFVIIRTIREIRRAEGLIAFTVIDDDFEMIIKNENGIDEGFYHMPAEVGIIAVTFGELHEEEDHAVTIHQLGL